MSEYKYSVGDVVVLKSCNDIEMDSRYAPVIGDTEEGGKLKMVKDGFAVVLDKELYTWQEVYGRVALVMERYNTENKDTGRLYPVYKIQCVDGLATMIVSEEAIEGLEVGGESEEEQQWEASEASQVDTDNDTADDDEREEEEVEAEGEDPEDEDVVALKLLMVTMKRISVVTLKDEDKVAIAWEECCDDGCFNVDYYEAMETKLALLLTTMCAGKCECLMN